MNRLTPLLLGENANTLVVGLEGKDYSTDLSDDNTEALRQAMAPYITAAKRVTGGTTKTTRKSAGTSSHAETKADREWAQANGYTVSDRGRIPADIMQAYAKA